MTTNAARPGLPVDEFRDPLRTARGEARARVALHALRTLWFHTGSRCNLACSTCYLESSPHDDRLAWLTLVDVERVLAEIAERALPVRTIGFTGGEPFLNPQLIDMLGAALDRGADVLVLTNGTQPMRRHEAGLLALRDRAGPRLALRVSLDHHDAEVHDAERGKGAFERALRGLQWLEGNGFRPRVAGRSLTAEPADEARAGYRALFERTGLSIDAFDPERLVLFPEMDATRDVPEITEACWEILGRSPDDVMCASSRMVVRRREATQASVVACTLLPHDLRFELGLTLAEASGPVPLVHPHCAAFCVLGGASCSG